MQIIAQNKEKYKIYEVEMKGNEIFGCVIVKKKQQKILLGTYETTKRTTEVLAELTCLSWNTKTEQTYIMPKE